MSETKRTFHEQLNQKNAAEWPHRDLGRRIYAERESNVRSIAQAIVEADQLTDFTLSFFDNYIALQRAEDKIKERP